MSEENVSASREIINRLQSVMLTRVLRQQPLPGHSQPVRFPDLAFIIEAPKVLVSDDNVSGPLEVAGVDKPVEVVPASKIREVAAESGDHAYVHFQPAAEVDDGIRIVMEVRLAPTEQEIPPLGLGGIQATFAQGPDGEWKATEPPAIYGI